MYFHLKFTDVVLSFHPDKGINGFHLHVVIPGNNVPQYVGKENPIAQSFVHACV